MRQIIDKSQIDGTIPILNRRRCLFAPYALASACKLFLWIFACREKLSRHNAMPCPTLQPTSDDDAMARPGNGPLLGGGLLSTMPKPDRCWRGHDKAPGALHGQQGQKEGGGSLQPNAANDTKTRGEGWSLQPTSQRSGLGSTEITSLRPSECGYRVTAHGLVLA